MSTSENTSKNRKLFDEGRDVMILWDLCITSPFAQFLRQSQILILEISDIFLWSSASSVEPLKFSPSLNLNKIEHSAKVSLYKEKTVAVTILSTILSEKMNSNFLIFYLSRFITILPLATSFMLQEYAV